jgi:molecular chaperone GrpE
MSDLEPEQDAANDLEARLAQAEDQRLRALADLDNLRKRCAAQVSSARTQASAAVVARWLPIVDNLDRAVSHARADPEAIIEGVMAVRDQALALVADLGFARRDAIGEQFDPAKHEAVAAVPNPDAEPGTVIDVVRPGYGEGDHQIRPAQVVVATDRERA